MSSRRQRRHGRETRPVIGRTELFLTGVVVVIAGVTLGVVLLLSGGDGDDASGNTGDQAAGVPATGTPFEASDEAGSAIVELGRRSVEALPQGQWANLYDAFTQEFHDRCARADFEAAGEADAANLGDSLSQIRFKHLTNVSIEGDTASAVIVGAVGDNEYTIASVYAREDGEWKIAPAPGTSGCNGFSRLSG